MSLDLSAKACWALSCYRMYLIYWTVSHNDLTIKTRSLPHILIQTQSNNYGIPKKDWYFQQLQVGKILWSWTFNLVKAFHRSFNGWSLSFCLKWGVYYLLTPCYQKLTWVFLWKSEKKNIFRKLSHSSQVFCLLFWSLPISSPIFRYLLQHLFTHSHIQGSIEHLLCAKYYRDPVVHKVCVFCFVFVFN